MISRIYINNFRTLINFELKLDKLNLLLGENGTGKSSVFDVLRRLQKFIRGDCNIDEAFPLSEFTCFGKKHPEQRFEIDLELPAGRLNYLLIVEHLNGEEKGRVKEERLSKGNGILFQRELDKVRLFRDDYSGGLAYPFDWTLSALATIMPQKENKKLTAFREQMNNIIVASISPENMETKSDKEEDNLAPDMRNFVSWYRRIFQENPELLHSLFEVLKGPVAGFSSFSFQQAGPDTKTFKLSFTSPEGETYNLDFSRISDGQRVLIVLYVLLYGNKNKNLCIFLDEPDGFVALREIQPWLAELTDKCGENFRQATIISHHPEVIDNIGVGRSIFFVRDDGGATRTKEIQVKDSPLCFSRLVARGDV